MSVQTSIEGYPLKEIQIAFKLKSEYNQICQNNG
jgi:hypothetical protein